MSDEGFCDVSISEFDGDSADVFHASIVTARKAHKCYECGESIQPTQQYERCSGKWDGRWEVYRFCLPCREIAEEFTDGARAYGVLWEELETNWDDGAHLQACLNRLTTVAAKEHMRRRWLKWKRLDREAL